MVQIRPRISLSETARLKVLKLSNRPEVLHYYDSPDAQRIARDSSLWVQVMAQQRQQDNQIDQSVRSMTVQI